MIVATEVSVALLTGALTLMAYVPIGLLILTDKTAGRAEALARRRAELELERLEFRYP